MEIKTLNEVGTMNFTIKVEDFLKMKTTHLVFFKYIYGNREENI